MRQGASIVCLSMPIETKVIFMCRPVVHAGASEYCQDVSFIHSIGFIHAFEWALPGMEGRVVGGMSSPKIAIQVEE